MEKRTVLRLDKRLAPVKAAVLPLSRNADLSPMARDLAATLRKNWNVDFDDAQAIGRRYRRQDEIGTPFCVTVDFDIARRPGRHRARARLDDPGARGARPGRGLPGRAPARLLTKTPLFGARVRARADGGHHQQRVPHAVPRVSAGRAVRLRDDHDAGAGRAQREDAAADPVRRRRAAALDPALRRRPGRRRRGRAHDRRGRPRRPHRPELRLPGAQGDPQGRGIGAAVAHRPVRRHRAQRGAQRRPGCRSR